MKQLIIKLINWYQKTISPDHGPNKRATCRFEPTCSEYTKQAVVKHGIKGLFMGFWRVLKCNPLTTKSGTYDPVK